MPARQAAGAPAGRVMHVVERCSARGVVRDEAADGRCEACGSALRPWCRAHGRDAGWLDGPACPRCAGEAAHPEPAAALHPRPRFLPVPPPLRPGPEPALRRK